MTIRTFTLPPGTSIPVALETRLLTKWRKPTDWAYYDRPTWTRYLPAAKNISLRKRLESL